MRPTKQETDLEFWLKQISFWKEKAEMYFLLSAKASNKEEEAFCDLNQDRCLAQKYKAELCFQEAQGLIEVYSGRANPKWAKKTAKIAVGNRLQAFTL